MSIYCTLMLMPVCYYWMNNNSNKKLYRKDNFHNFYYKYKGHFTQMVWLNTKYFGIGKATSHTGKIFVVAYYYPPGIHNNCCTVLIKNENKYIHCWIFFVYTKGNIVNAFHENVLLPPMDDAQAPKDADNNTPITSILKGGPS